MPKSLRRWFYRHWKTKEGKAGFGAALFGVLGWAKDTFYWVVDLPGRWHQMNEWANALPLARIHISPWLETAVFVCGIGLLIWNGKKKPRGVRRASLPKMEPPAPPIVALVPPPESAISPTAITPNIKFVDLKYITLKFPDHMTPNFPAVSGVNGAVAYFRNEIIVGISPPPLLDARAHLRFFDSQGTEVVSIDSAPWVGQGIDSRTLNVGMTVGVILAISGDESQQFARSVTPIPSGYSWGPGETFGFIDKPIPNHVTRAEVVLIDRHGLSIKPFGFTIIEGWLFDPDSQAPNQKTFDIC